MFRFTAISVSCLHYRSYAFTYSFSRSTYPQCMIAIVSKIRRTSIKERRDQSCQISIHHDSETYNETNFPRMRQLFGIITSDMQVRALEINNNRANSQAMQTADLRDHQFIKGKKRRIPMPHLLSHQPPETPCLQLKTNSNILSNARTTSR